MSVTYRPVGWNPQKRTYDLVAGGAVLAYLTLFLASQAIWHPELTVETLLLRATGSAAFLLLHVVLSIGPLVRLVPRLVPLLYNRRHLGVLTFLVALVHGMLALVQFHTLGDLHPLVSVLIGNPRIDDPAHWPFQPFGLAALGILFLMAATSHDFWLHQLTAPVWKTLHMGVYVAYALIVLHVAFGVMAGEINAGLALSIGAAVLTLATLHGVAGWREARHDRPPARGREPASDGFVDVCDIDDIPERRAIITCLMGERVALFRYEEKISALSNVCQHQNGPLGEGRIVRDCVVCPWHGYEYLPASGASPAPFTEKVPTFHVRLAGRRVLVHPQPNPPGTYVEPARIDAGTCHEERTRA